MGWDWYIISPIDIFGVLHVCLVGRGRRFGVTDGHNRMLNNAISQPTTCPRSNVDTYISDNHELQDNKKRAVAKRNISA